MGRHLRIGAYILENLSIPRIDLFSHTAEGRAFIPYEWLSEVIYASFHTLGGLAGVAVLASLLFAGAVVLTYWTTVRMGVPRLVAFLFAVWGLTLQAVHLLPRPHLFTTLFTAVTYFLLLEHRRKAPEARAIWLLPVLFAVWANLHGGFLIGFILLFFFLADAGRTALLDPAAGNRSRARTIALVTATCFVATLVNPAGFALWPHTTGYLKIDYLVDMTHEYQSPDFHQPIAQVFMVALLFGTAIGLFRRSRVELLGGALFLLTAAFSLYSGRNIPIFAVVAMPWMAAWTFQTVVQESASTWPRARGMVTWLDGLDRIDRSLRSLPLLLGICTLLFAVALSSGRRDAYRFSAEKFPVDAVAHLRETGFPPGNVFNEFHWGGYLLYASWPDVPVFIDGQTDFYGESLTRDFMTIRNLSPNWKSLLESYRVQWALLPGDAPLSSALSECAGWHTLYSDDTAVVFERRRDQDPDDPL